MGSLVQLGNHAQFRNGATFSNLFFPFSLRRYNLNYTGMAIRVRRSLNADELDIGFINNELDIVSLMNFAGSGSAFISAFYVQENSINNLISTNSSFQPRIVNNGVLEVQNGKPSIYFNSYPQFLDFTNQLPIVPARTIFAVFSNLANDINSAYPYFNVSGVIVTGGNNNFYSVNNLGATGVYGSFGSNGSNYSNLNQRTWMHKNGNTIVGINGNKNTLTTVPNVASITRVGGRDVHPFKGWLSELIIFQRELSLAEINLIEQNQMNYWLSPGLIT